MFPNLIWLSSCPVYAPTEILQLNLVTKEIQELQETLTLYCVTEDFFFSCLQKESRSSKKHKENKEQAVNSIDSSTNRHLCLITFLIWAPYGAGVLCLSPKLPWGWNRHAKEPRHCTNTAASMPLLLDSVDLAITSFMLGKLTLFILPQVPWDLMGLTCPGFW